jgi:SWI/SNF-related matrix-associated actin-dependent regulator of chromatin subfamily A member 5
MKEMIQYGADKIFKAGDDFKDEEIDIILERGEKNTTKFFEEAETQAKNKTTLLLNMSFNTTDLYRFENEDYMAKRKLEYDVMSKSLVEEFTNDERINRRKNICNYNIDQNFEQLLQNKNPKKKTRLPKIPFYHLYNFKDRLYELKSKQINYFHEKGSKLPEKFDEDITISEGLSAEEITELNNILQTGFTNWERKEYETVVNLIDKHGRNCYEQLKAELENKSIDEIKDYCKVFWERIMDLPDGSKIVRNIEKREKIEKQKENASKLISKKMSTAENSYENIKLNYPTNYKNTEFSTDEDQYLLFLTYTYGYGMNNFNFRKLG